MRTFEEMKAAFEQLCRYYKVPVPTISEALPSDPCDVTDPPFVRINLRQECERVYQVRHLFGHYLHDLAYCESRERVSYSDDVADVVARMIDESQRPAGQSEPVALIDLDGTVADFDGALRRKLVGMACSTEATDKDYLISVRQEPYMKARRRLVKSQPGFWRDLPVLGAGMNVVEMMRELGFTLMVLTKGPSWSSSAWTEKVEWTKLYIPDAGITITEDKGLVYGKVLFDDWPEYISRWLAWRPRGLVIMTNQPWNQDFEHPNVFRFNHPKAQDHWDKHLEELRALLKEARER